MSSEVYDDAAGLTAKENLAVLARFWIWRSLLEFTC